MPVTLISHFYNEEYLLPHWLNHHKKIFDHGILIDYGSTDNSIDIIKNICPNWEIVKSVNPDFDAIDCDVEIMNYESKIDGFRIALNTTEFILGNFDMLKNITEKTQFLIPCNSMYDSPDFEFKEIEGDLFENRTWGIHHTKNFMLRRARSLHNYNLRYDIGRHFGNYNTDEFIILWYGYSPFNEQIIKRKLQIQNKTSRRNIEYKFGFQHMTTREELCNNLKIAQNEITNLKEEIEIFKKKTFG